MKTIEEKIAVMRAFAYGKKIEVSCKGSNWVEKEDPHWNWEGCDYRIKPEPKYRPYASANECLAGVQKHGGWIKDYNHDMYYYITDIANSAGKFNGRFSIYQDLFFYYVWADDGSPCGVIEKE